LNPADLQRAQEAFSCVRGDVPTSVRSAGEDLLSGLATSDWELEWSLPRWLAEPLALSEDVVGRLVAANALGLGYVRLIDDCRDRENARLEFADMERLANVFYRAAIGVYLELLGPHAWFWSQVGKFLHQWRAVGFDDVSIDVFHAAGAQVQRLAHLGSPLHIGGAAVCAISGQEARLAEMTLPIHHYLIASVLLDHMADWQEDLQAGRPNLFVRALLHDEPSGWQPPRATMQLREAFLRTRPVQDYLGLVARHFHIALFLSRDQRLHGLAKYLEIREQATKRDTENLVQAIQGTLDQAAEMLFKPVNV
jgi:hypothetical protein